MSINLVTTQTNVAVTQADIDRYHDWMRENPVAGADKMYGVGQ